MSGKSASGDLIEIAEARRLLDAEAEKVVSLKFSYISGVIFN